jgi:hypothetical protein
MHQENAQPSLSWFWPFGRAKKKRVDSALVQRMVKNGRRTANTIVVLERIEVFEPTVLPRLWSDASAEAP